MRPVRPLLAFALLALAAPALNAQRGDPVARLEAAREANPANVAALRALGVAYYKADRYRDAHAVLDQARQLNPADGVSALYAGLSAEAVDDYDGARAAYSGYLEFGKSRRVRNAVRDRLVALARLEIVAAAKAAVANEATLSQTPGSPQTIAVPPLHFSGADQSLAPLERGLAELIITDLGRSAQLTLVERDRMQALADEIQLSSSDLVEAGSAARAGRLLQAGRLVTGAIIQSGSQLTLSSNIVDVATSELSTPAAVTNDLDALFALQKQLVFRIFDQLGVTLTPAERQLVDRHATTNMDAFLAYSRGLAAADDGRFEDATRFFDEARAHDPGFGAAAAQFQAAQAALQGTLVTSASLESGLQGTTEGAQIEAASRGELAATDGVNNTVTRVAQDVNPPSVTPVANTDARPNAPAPPVRDATSSTGGTDEPTPRTGSVTVIIRRP
ncbi:MAG: tetratricopeptide repeat protein [Gemmatimonadaceae bacterium]